MAKVTVRRILKEDLQRDAKDPLPDWLDALIYVFNLLLDQIVAALARSLTFTENMRAQVVEIRFNTGASYSANEFTVQKIKWDFAKAGVKPSGVITLQTLLVKQDQAQVIYTPIYAATQCDWLYNEGQVEIRYISGLANDCQYLVRLLLI